jgi:basic membrane lipoprotein Med (substrate-binding protein (PBP1-ABC) superfamily)
MKHKRMWICIIITLLGALLTAGVVAAAQLQTQAESTSLAATKVGLIPEKEGITQDNLWTWASYQGLLKAETELGVIGTIYTPTDDTNYGPQLQQCAD